MPLRKQTRNRQGQAAAERIIRELQQHGGPFVDAVQATRMPMVLTDPRIADNPIIYANAAFLSMCGYEAEEVLGQSYLSFASETNSPDVIERLSSVNSARQNFTERLLLKAKDGHEIWVMAFIHPVIEGGRVVRHFASFLDITDQVNREQELQKATELLDRRVGVKARKLHEVNRQLELEVERRHRTEAVLRDALEEVERDLRFRDFLIHEIHHRTKNALQIAASLLGMQARQSKDPSTREALEAATGRLQRIGEVHGLLTYRTDAPDSIDLSDYLRRISQTTVESFAPAAGQIRVNVDVEYGVAWSSDIVVPLGLIVGEALTNALKHAFPDGRRGRVLVQLRSTSDDRMRLRVEDDGVGVPAQRKKDKLGLRLIDVLAKQIKGSASLHAKPDGGTVLLVTFPDPRISRV